MRNKLLRIGPTMLFVALGMLLSGCSGDLSNAAKVMKSYRISLGAFQDAEIGAYQKGFISQPRHAHTEADIEKLANLGIIADTAILASDKATVIVDIGNALAVIDEIEKNDITAIGDQTTRGAIGVAVAGIKNLLEQVSISLGGK